MRKDTPKNGTSLRIENLEARELLAADFLDAIIPAASMEGTGNNLANPQWGCPDEQLIRLTDQEYSDGFSAPAGEHLASPREISNEVNAQFESIENARQLTDLVWVFGQFLDHDISITGSASPREVMDIEVPTGDLYFDPFGTGTQVISFSRSICEGGDSAGSVREQLNQITAFIDGSVIYGSSQERTDALREFSGGRLKTSSGNLLPYNTQGLENAGGPSESLFLAGDIRANENIALIAMHTTWLREHNRIAAELETANAALTDEQVFQTARAIVRAQLQSITFNEFLPALLGHQAMPRYTGYDPAVNPSIANEFSTAAYRFGHSMLSTELLRLNPDGTVAEEGNIALQQAFFRPGEIAQFGIESILQGVAAGTAQEIDTQVIDDIRNFLFGPPGSGGFDLASLNIQRGRDHGLADYNQVRVDLGLKPVTRFSDITTNRDLQIKLEQVYGTVDNIDLWIGGLAEDHLKGSSMGETFSRVLVDQFSRLRDGDRFWYQNLFDGTLIQQIEQTTLADVIQRNSGVANLQENAFFDAQSQPRKTGQPLVINLPKTGKPLRVIVHAGFVDVKAGNHTSRTMLLGDSSLVIRGTSKADHITIDLRDSSVTQLDRIVINAGGGHDFVRVVGVHPDFDGEIRINGQKGRDHLRASHVDAAINMFGGANRDRLIGGDRNDRLFGGGGDDLILGGPGDDTISGGRGNDRLNGEQGSDRLAETMAADTSIADRRLQNELNEIDRLMSMETALLFNYQGQFDLDFDELGNSLELHQPRRSTP